MAEITSELIVEIDLPNQRCHLVFKSPTELREWILKENQTWQWLGAIQDGCVNPIQQSRNSFLQQISELVNRWQSYQTNKNETTQILQQIRNCFNLVNSQNTVILTANPATHFIQELLNTREPLVAAGAYAGILNARFQSGSPISTALLDGVFEALLYKREVDWTATAHQKALGQLQTQYDSAIAKQNERFKELEQTNDLLNRSFEASLNDKKQLLDNLHQQQSTDFDNLTKKHTANLAAIEQTYDQKLALRRPVQYWKKEQQFHSKRASLFGWVSLGCGLVCAGGLGCLAYKFLGNIAPKEEPKHWQIGILIVGAFFAIWIVRILVRLFLSHLHLATDASERRMMILTYLAFAREAKDVSVDDKKLILQHIFRSASDGLVKDDAAPPSLFEVFSRK